MSSSSSRPPRQFTRRAVLKAAAGLGAVTLGGPAAPSPREDREVIRRENGRAGTRDWMLTRTGVDPATRYRCPWIEGWCSAASVRTGETIRFHVSTNPASPFRLDLFRMGFYGGLGGRQVAALGPFPGAVQPDPPIGPQRVRDCAWEPCASLKIPADWPSGVYVGKLTAERGGWQSYVIFIVRDDRPADFLFQCSDNTWQAYNRWPDQFALYDDGKQEWYCGPGVAMSFSRPYGKYCQILDAPLSTGSGEFFLWEFPFVFWLEANGYDVTYASNLDTHRDPDGLLRAKGLLSVGHDEYWSLEMYRNVERAIARGVSAGFFSGNTCCGRITYSPAGDGTPDRVFERTDYFGPRDEGMIARFPTMAPFPYTSPHEGRLMGARNVPPCTGGADWVCTAPDHWLYAGTGMQAGNRIPGLIGWEFHGDPAPIPGLDVVASAPTQDAPGKLNDGVYAATVYPGPRGGIVFNASTCWWADGLSAPPGYVRPSVYTSPQGPDPRVQQITRNVLERMRRVA